MSKIGQYILEQEASELPESPVSNEQSEGEYDVEPTNSQIIRLSNETREDLAF